MPNAAVAAVPSVEKSSQSGQSVPILIALHLVPGALATLVYLVTAPLVMSLGYPTLAALYVPMALTVIVLELAFLLYQGQKRNGRLSLNGIVSYREPILWWQYLVFPLLILVVGILGSAVLGLVDNALLQTIFSGLPDWYLLKNIQQLGSQYPRTVLLTLFGFALVLNGLAGPIVEEMYFRGYLLPRLERFGRLAPLINSLLFSLYHFWTPWQFFSRLALVLPFVYVVRWKRNLYLGMIAHCAANLIGTTLLFLGLMR